MYHSIANTAHELLNNVPGFVGICEALHIMEQFQPLNLPVAASTSTSVTGDSTLDSALAGAATGVIDTLAPGSLQILGIDLTGKNIANEYSKIITPITLPAQSIQALIIFNVTNLGAFTFRAILVLIGLVILIALVINVTSENVDIDQIAGLAAMAA
jgi:hypothetical protein